jgi:acetate---CoA ligase (ADP-forming)
MSKESGDSLSALFAPDSVAVVGASDDPDRLSGRPIRYLLEGGYAGAIYPVNPNRDRVQGLQAYPSIEALPQTPAVALIVVPAKAVKEAVIACGQRGVRGVYLLSGGFAESGEEGERSQREIQRIAAEAGMRMLGPNCLGAFNSQTRFFGTFASSLEGSLPDSGPVAIVSQSGAYGQHLAYLMRKRGLGVKYLISTGNEIDVELAECIAWLAGQPEVEVILAYAEGIRQGQRLTEALEGARRAGKPVIFVKVGASDAGASAAASHTAALAGSDAVHDAVFRQFGAYRASSTDEQVDVAYACVKARAMTGSKVGIVSLSGGFGVQAADAAEGVGLEVSPLLAESQARLGALLPGGGGTNPIDVTGQAVNDVRLLSESLGVVTGDGGYDALFVCLTTTPLAAALEGPIRQALVASTAEYRRGHPVVLLMVAAPAVVAAYETEGFLVFEDVVRAVKAVGALAFFQRSFQRGRIAASALPAAAAVPTGAISEVQAKRLLRSAGVPLLEEVLVRSADEAVAAAQTAGTPVAMKIVSPDILHKTEIGGVLLGVSGASSVRQAHDTLLTRAAAAAPEARIEGILVSPMAGQGVETILGVARDPIFGPIVMFGLGGVLAECFRDTSFRVAPICAAEAHRMVEETRAALLLRGWRGAPPSDLDALVDAIVNLSQFAAANATTIESIDVNPFLVRTKGAGAVALDAVVIGSKQ